MLQFSLLHNGMHCDAARQPRPDSSTRSGGDVAGRERERASAVWAMTLLMRNDFGRSNERMAMVVELPPPPSSCGEAEDGVLVSVLVRNEEGEKKH